MKATGIVRRIDDLGRVVVPKEIRRTMRIREGDPLEIYTDREGEIILKKYSPIGEMGIFAKQYADTLGQATGHIVCISDRDQVIAAAGTAKKDIIGKALSRELEEAMTERESIVASSSDRNYLPLVEEEGENDYRYQVMEPIISEGDVIGCVMLLTKDDKVKMGEAEVKLAKVAASFLGRQMES
ncbi:MAG: stage V sporulation protein T [Lachnospiraceae bacterium]|jgi:AbrB family transcriptional regulator (stage V sporulation protein T)|nr:stage V sporulation protein T [Lachnospiraceae bacterium]MCX4315664.1 stage V sporulation protein T [Lachnospiraceae bacterium]